jgi:hypothetical protein
MKKESKFLSNILNIKVFSKSKFMTNSGWICTLWIMNRKIMKKYLSNNKKLETSIKITMLNMSMIWINSFMNIFFNLK